MRDDESGCILLLRNDQLAAYTNVQSNAGALRASLSA